MKPAPPVTRQGVGTPQNLAEALADSQRATERSRFRRRRVRLVSWALAFAVGDALAASGVAGWRAAAAVALVAVASLGVRRSRALAGPLLFLALGGVLGERAARVPPLAPALAAAVESDEPRAIEAVVVHGPEETANGTRLIVRLTALDDAPAEGTLALSVANGWPDFGPGETIACRAKLRALRGTRNPGLPDPVLALRAVGIDALAGVPTAGAIRRLAEPAGFGPRRAAYLARRAMRNAIDRAVDGEAGAFLKTAVLGDRRAAPHPKSRKDFAPRGPPTSCLFRGLAWRRSPRCSSWWCAAWPRARPGFRSPGIHGRSLPPSSLPAIAPARAGRRRGRGD